MQTITPNLWRSTTKNITRPGADRLLNWLETTDFSLRPRPPAFTARASRGLVMHSINVYNDDDAAFFHRG